MLFFLFAAFESFLFPRNIFVENQYNPATLYQPRYEVMIATEVKYGLADLRTYAINAQIKSYGLSLASFGSGIYRENVIGFGFGLPIVNKFAAGIRISLINYWIKDNENQFGYSLGLGSIFHGDPLEIGFWLNNINEPKLSDIDYLPANYSVRCVYWAKNNLSFYFAARGIETQLPFFNWGLFYAPYKLVQLGAGINTKPMLFEYGLKIFLGEFNVSYAGSSHPQLGLTHNLHLSFDL